LIFYNVKNAFAFAFSFKNQKHIKQVHFCKIHKNQDLSMFRRLPRNITG